MITIRSIDVMKLSKDNVNNQISPSEIDQIFTIYKTNYPSLTHIAIAVPLNSNDEFKAHGNNPSPLAVEDYEKLWVEKIHANGWGVLFRGTFCDTEGLYNFPITKADGQTWQAKALAYVERITPQLQANDIIGILPESTENAFNGNLFLTGSMPNDYNIFFVNLIGEIKKIIPQGVKVYITNNWTELNSGWAGGIPSAMGAVVQDDYQQTIDAQKANIESSHSKYSLPVFVQEWGNIWNSDPTLYSQMATLFSSEPNLIGINWWCGWDTPNEGILTHANGTWTLNDKGKALIPFFSSGTTPPESIPPTPTPSPLPSIVKLQLINTDTQKVVTDPFVDGSVIDLSITKNWNINVITSPDFVGSVVFDYDGNGTYHTENILPYDIGGDTNGKFNAWTPTIGSHTLKVTPFTKSDGQGEGGTSLSITFSAENPPIVPVPTPTPIKEYALTGTISFDDKGHFSLKLDSSDK